MAIKKATTYEEWKTLALQHDRATEMEEWKVVKTSEAELLI